METLKARLIALQNQLGGLSASQKMLTASLVAIIVMTLFWWGRYAGTAEMEALLDQSLSSEDMGRMRTVLGGAGIDSRIVNDRLMVPAERRLEALASLTYNDALPSKGSNAWEEMFKQMSPWDPKSKTDSIQNHGKEQFLQQVFTTLFKDVAKASVGINANMERRIGGNLEPTASVVLVTRGRNADIKRLRDAVASTVASTVSGLARQNVSVVIDGIVQRVSDASEGMGGEMYEQMKMLREENEQNVLRMLPRGSLVAVTVELETSSIQERSKVYDPTKVVQKEKTIEENKEETTQTSTQANEPGALPNAALSIGGASNSGPSGGTNTTISKDKTEMQNFVSESDITKMTPAGRPTVVSAAVRLPRSVYLTRFKNANPNAKDDDKGIDALFEQEKVSIRDTVLKTVNLKNEQDLAISMYDDGGVPLLAAISDAQNNSGGGGTMSVLFTGHAKEIALGALAVISLFMVSTIVKKGTPIPVVTPDIIPRETPRIGSEEDIAGIVGGEAPQTLDGMELDEGSVKAQQMVEQVATMVKENPDAAATLVKRWLNRS